MILPPVQIGIYTAPEASFFDDISENTGPFHDPGLGPRFFQIQIYGVRQSIPLDQTQHMSRFRPGLISCFGIAVQVYAKRDPQPGTFTGVSAEAGIILPRIVTAVATAQDGAVNVMFYLFPVNTALMFADINEFPFDFFV